MSRRSRRFDIGADCRKTPALCMSSRLQASVPVEKGRCKVYGTGVERLGFGKLLEFWGARSLGVRVLDVRTCLNVP